MARCRTDAVEEPEFPAGITSDMTAHEALAFTVAFLDGSPGDATLCLAALTIAEPLVDWHWQELEDQLVDLVAHRSNARKMMSCCMFDPSVPDRVINRLLSHVRSEEDIGRRPS